MWDSEQFGFAFFARFIKTEQKNCWKYLQKMAESDDEYDRKRRDKFRGERSSGGDNYRSDRRDDRRGRDDWPDR